MYLTGLPFTTIERREIKRERHLTLNKRLRLLDSGPHLQIGAFGLFVMYLLARLCAGKVTNTVRGGKTKDVNSLDDIMELDPCCHLSPSLLN